MLLLFFVLGFTLTFAEEYYKYNLTFAYANFRGIAKKSGDSGIESVKIISVQSCEWNKKEKCHVLSPTDLSDLYDREETYHLVELRVDTAKDENEDVVSKTEWEWRRVIEVLNTGSTLQITCDTQTSCNFMTYWKNQLYYGVGVDIKEAAGQGSHQCFQLDIRGQDGKLLPLDRNSLKDLKNSAITPFGTGREPFDPTTTEWIPIDIYEISKHMSSKPEFWYQATKKTEVGVRITLSHGANPTGEFLAAVYKNLYEPKTEMLSGLRGLYGRFTMSICNKQGAPIEFDNLFGTPHELQIEVDGSWWTVKKLTDLVGKSFHFAAVVEFWIVRAILNDYPCIGFMHKCTPNENDSDKQLVFEVSSSGSRFYSSEILWNLEAEHLNIRFRKVSTLGSDLQFPALAVTTQLDEIIGRYVREIPWSPICIKSVDDKPSLSLATLTYTEYKRIPIDVLVVNMYSRSNEVYHTTIYENLANIIQESTLSGQILLEWNANLPMHLPHPNFVLFLACNAPNEATKWRRFVSYEKIDVLGTIVRGTVVLDQVTFRIHRRREVDIVVTVTIDERMRVITIPLSPDWSTYDATTTATERLRKSPNWMEKVRSFSKHSFSFSRRLMPTELYKQSWIHIKITGHDLPSGTDRWFSNQKPTTYKLTYDWK